MTVHLARKWRSKNFNELVGQELSVRLLKNSLFKKTFFPAYLFSGLRGSGKTSMGRIFAAAVNCQQLDLFTKEPQKTIIPCGECVSCKALFAGQHPDFIEIDAASHTGVDNMRLIIENASLLPVLASKKIYLIDEAHMLSKAAFNACLKILEEPPMHVMFILATTDPEKIIETIKSRCFQVFFDPIPLTALVNHLKHICDTEKIAYDQQGLTLLVEQSSGSARDALTTLERVALAQGNVTAASVQSALGLLQKELIESLLTHVLAGDSTALFAFMQAEKLLTYDSFVVWRSLTDLIRACLYDSKIIKDTAAYNHLVALLTVSYETELLLSKTSMQAAVVEYMLIRMATIKSQPQVSPSAAALPITSVGSPVAAPATPVVTVKKVEAAPAMQAVASQATEWQKFIELIKVKVEPLVLTLFSSAAVTYVSATQRCEVSCLKEHELFKEWLDNSVVIWKPLVQEAFGAPVELDIRFTQLKDASKPAVVRQPASQQRPVSPNAQQTAPARAQAAKPVSENVSKALKLFPGTIQEV